MLIDHCTFFFEGLYLKKKMKINLKKKIEKFFIVLVSVQELLKSLL